MNVKNNACRVLTLWMGLAAAAPAAPSPTPAKPAAGGKTIVALLTLKNTTGVEAGEAEVISDRLRNELFGTGAVEVMERDQMQAILKEQGFQQSGACTDEGCMVEIGQLLGLQRIITGSIGKLGRIFMINLRAVDVATGKLVRVVSRDIKGDIEDVVEVLPALGREIAGLDAASEPVRATPPTSSEKEEPAPKPIPAPVRGAEVYFERFVPSKDVIRFSLTGTELDDINTTIRDALDEAIDPDVQFAPAEQLSSVAGSKALVIRLRLLSYSKKPAAMKQFEGTAEVSVEFYEGPAATSPACAVRIKETGDRHWGDSTPFANAMEEIASTIEDDLGDADFVKKFNKSH